MGELLGNPTRHVDVLHVHQRIGEVMKALGGLLLCLLVALSACGDNETVTAGPATESSDSTQVVEPVASPCDGDEEFEFSPLEETYVLIEDWWEITEADDEALSVIEAMDVNDPKGWGEVVVAGEHLAGVRSGEPLSQIIIDLSLAPSLRTGLAASARVYVGTQADLKSTVVLLVRFDDGRTMFGGFCGNRRHLETLTRIHDSDLETVLDEMISLTGQELVVYLEISETTTTDAPTGTTVVSPPTTGEFGNALTRPTNLERLDFVGFEIGEVRVIDWTLGCGSFGLHNGPEERFLQDRPIVTPSSGLLVRSDFPSDWSVFIYNETAHDGSEYVLLDVVVTRFDEDTIEMRASADGPLIANFLRDKTDPADWESC